MLKYIARRLLMLIPVLLGVTLLVFSLMYITPGDPVDSLLGDNATPEAREALREELGLNGGYFERFFNYVVRLLRGDMGICYSTRQNVATRIAQTFPNTVKLASFAVVFAVVFGLTFGIVSAIRQYSIIDNIVMSISMIGISMPSFWCGLLLMLLFYLYTRYVSGKIAVEEKKTAEAALQAETDNIAKERLKSEISHDIRTPMNAIIGMTTIASMHIDDRERIVDCLKKIMVSSKLLLNLINEVLDMSKVESGHILLTDEEFDMGELLQSVITMVQTSVSQKFQDFRVHLFQIKHEMRIGDVQRIQQVLLNLLSNAIKYTPDYGKITLEIREKPIKNGNYGLFEVTVIDNGIGIKPDFLHKVFEPFERAEDATLRNIQGTGLGMAISRNIAHMMNGEILVESEYGKGSVFTFTMQLILQDQGWFEDDHLRDLPVLVVDDDIVCCENACMRINEIGMKGEYAISGEEAIGKVERAHHLNDDYFAVILDLKMPGMDGIETATRIRKVVGRDIPIIILSAYDCPHFEEIAQRAGVDGFISKPLMKSKLFYLMKSFAIKQEEKEEETEKPQYPFGNFEGKRILLVEDNSLNREIATVLLEETGAVVEEAENGLVAVNMEKNSSPGYYDLVFMDIQMPVMNGYDSSRHIRALERPDIKTMPIIAMSANAFAEDIKLCKESGMNEHIAKPIDFGKVLEILEKYL